MSLFKFITGFILANIYIYQYLINGQVNYAICDNPLYCSVLSSCPRFSCKGSDLKTLYNASECGCCHKCIKELKEGDECQSEMSGNVPGTECGPHLRCVKDGDDGQSVCRPIYKSQNETQCEGKRKAMLDKSVQTKGEPIPDCDEYGDYAPKICKNGTLCNCQDKNGKRLFGLSPYANANDMDCLCSRQYDEVSKQLAEINFTMEAVNYLRCKSNGNYEPFQFAGNITYCVNTTSGEMLDMPIHRKYVEQLKCYKYKYDYQSDCQRLYVNATEEIKKLEFDDEYDVVVGYDIPRCDLDGTFAPVQCQNNKCYCVNKYGDKYKATEVDRTDKYGATLAKSQNCNCIRELELIRDIGGSARTKVTDMYARYKCDRNGNYLPLQCDDSSCYCVDESSGFQTSKNSTLKSDCSNMLNSLPECMTSENARYLLEPYKDEGGCPVDDVIKAHH